MAKSDILEKIVTTKAQEVIVAQVARPFAMVDSDARAAGSILRVLNGLSPIPVPGPNGADPFNRPAHWASRYGRRAKGKRKKSVWRRGRAVTSNRRHKTRVIVV